MKLHLKSAGEKGNAELIARLGTGRKKAQETRTKPHFSAIFATFCGSSAIPSPSPGPRQTGTRVLLSAEGGTVLLETVIATPLFLLLIGGIMWFGQLIYEKQKLVIADRYVAWNAGNRYGAQWNDVQQRFFDGYTLDQASVPQPVQSNSNNWWHGVFAYVNLQVNMPVWTRGWLAADALMKGQNVPDYLAGSFVLHGRDLPPDGQLPGGHVVIMRSPGYSGTRNSPVNAAAAMLGVKYQQLSSTNGGAPEEWAPGGEVSAWARNEASGNPGP